MSLLNKIAQTEKTIEVTYPETDFKLNLAYVPKERLQKIRQKALKQVWNASTRVSEEEVDNDIFLQEYSSAVIKGWSGLTVEVLATLMAIDTTGTDLTPDSIVDYTAEDAQSIFENSSEFDGWITTVINDVERFSTVQNEKKVKNSNPTSSKV
jgi:hypothetical protein